MTEYGSGMKITLVEACVFRRTGAEILFLLLKRKSRNYEGLWQGISGKIEDNEKAWETALRELREETGLKASSIFTADYVSAFYEAFKDRIVQIPVFGIEVESDVVKLSSEHSEFQWVKLGKALKLLTWRGQREALENVYDMLNSQDERLRWSSIKLDR